MNQKIKTNTNLLKAKRVEKGYSQENMGNFMKLSPISYGLKERGEYEFSQSEIANISIILDLSIKVIDEIFFEGKLTDVLNRSTTPTKENELEVGN